jgi:tellurite resistance protein TerC
MGYTTGFAVEKTLAMNSVSAVAVILAFFAVPRRLRHRVPSRGILGVVVPCAVMIGLGAASSPSSPGCSTSSPCS